MKKIFTASIIIASCFINKAMAQANKNLSNLTAPTAINTGLLPGIADSIDLGSTTKRWKNIYFKGNFFYGDVKAIVFDTSNTAVGLNALAITTGTRNTAIGKEALALNAGYNNVAAGYRALYSNTTGFSNTANGTFALFSNTTGSYNTANGHLALYSNTSGHENTANGHLALYSNTSGHENTANGFRALYSNTTGLSNTANGSSALYSNTTGQNNTATGYLTLYSNTSGYENTANGTMALYLNTTGNYNTAYGRSALRTNTTGSYNAANGVYALFSNTTGTYNTATGYYALYANTTGARNTSNGSESLYSNTSGLENSANGYRALYNNTTGSYNTAEGKYALYSNTTGISNTAIGVSALYTNTTGSNNTALGPLANVGFGDLTNATAIGYKALVNASNKVVIGNSSVTVIGGWTSWSDFSDGRFKSNIKQNVPGLAFINKLKPVTYTLDIKKFDRFIGKKDSLINASKDEYAIAEKKIHTGFIAQEVEQAAKELKYDFDGVNAPTHDKDNYSIAYADFVPSLVKSVQELSVQNDAKQDQIDSLRSELNELKQLVLSIQKTQQPDSYSSMNIAAATAKTTLVNEASLQQNIPNPFSNSTVINYTLPKQYAQAYIIITDKNGRTLKQATLTGHGKGSTKIDAGVLPSGSYYYSLVVDGKQVAAKQMIIIK